MGPAGDFSPPIQGSRPAMPALDGLTGISSHAYLDATVPEGQAGGNNREHGGTTRNGAKPWLPPQL